MLFKCYLVDPEKALKDKKYFATVSVSRYLGTIIWDNGADISPECLYENLSSEI